MNSRKLSTSEFREAIEAAFPSSVAVWAHSGYPGEEFEGSNLEVFEAYNINEDDYDRFSDLVWELQKTVAKPNGFSLIEHDVTQEETSQFRWPQYNAELARRKQSPAQAPKERRSAKPRKEAKKGTVSY